MKRWKITSHFEALGTHSVLLVLGAWLILSAHRFPFTTYACAVVFYALVSRDRTWPAAMLILALYLLPTGFSSETMRQGRVTAVRDRYAVVTDHGHNMLVYTRSRPILDSIIRFDGIPVLIEPSSGFYKFDFADYCRRQGITLSVSPDTIEEVQPTHSLRGLLMKHILRSGSPHTNLLLEILFQIRSEDTFQGIFADRSFSLAGVLVFLRFLLKYWFCEPKRTRILTGITIVLALVFHFPYLLTQRLISMGLEQAGLKGRTKQGISFLIGLRLYPWVTQSASFLIPAVYAFTGTSQHTGRLERFFRGMQMESILFHTVRPLELLAFSVLMPVSGLVWMLAFFEALSGIPFTIPVQPIDRCFDLLRWITLPGTMLGGGLVFYLLLSAGIRSGPNRLKLRCALFLLFQSFGLFHPFAEVTFINVGQGDSILIRGPLSTSDILIDTGKPSQWNAVETILEAKGIRRLDVLIITHGDQDHNGNQEQVIETFHPKQVITSHHEPLTSGFLSLYDLNPVVNADENESSITDYLLLNGMKLLLMADVSKKTEEAIIRQYPNLSCDLLKLAHHGSHTGTSEIFLNTVRPYLGIISSGAYSIYHHPSPEVTERLKNHRIPYLNTREEGDISILCLMRFNVLLTSRGKIAIIRV